MKVALIAGATGLIGKHLLQLLLEDPEYHLVKALSRRPLSINHPKLETILTDADTLADHQQQLKCDDVFCCLGTTMKTAGSKEAFEKVDYHYPLSLAQYAKELGAKQYLLVSALGADKNASIYYNSVKGRIEEAIQKEGYQSFHIFRPSLLLGDRSENRSGEEAAKVFYRLFGFLIPAKYKAIEASKVANAMRHFARQEDAGVHIHESKTLQAF